MMENYNNSADSSEITWAVLAHLSMLIAMVISVGWLSFVGPLVLYFIYRDRSLLVRKAAAGAFNFAISMTILSIVSWVCVFTIILLPLAIILFIVCGILSIYYPIKAALVAKDGRIFNYPLTLELLK